MDAAQRKALKAELETALAERQKLDVVIAYLGGRLGNDEARPPSDAGLDSDLLAKVQRTPAESVGKGQFQGKSATKAARQVLGLFGPERPLRTQELFDALAKGGVRVKNANVLHRSLNRDETFCRVERGLWGLSEWQGDATDGAGDEPDRQPSRSAQAVPPLLPDEGEAADGG